MSDNRIKKAVIREDLLAITGDYRKAILLNQFIYWSERVSDADKFIEKENEIAKNNGEDERELFYGWIYKTAEELADEVMLGLSASQIRRYINDLVDLGYLSKRNNPKYKWDRTLQYRVNLVNIAKSLKAKGYPLSDYKIEIPDDENTNTHERAINNAQAENQSQSSERAIPENTNRDYINRDYSTENTDKYTFPDKSEKGEDIYTSLSDGKEEVESNQPKPNRYIPDDYTEEQLREHIRPIIKENFERIEQENDIVHFEYRMDMFEDIVVEFYRQYEENIGVKHRILPDKSLIRVMERYINIDEPARGINDFGTYKEIIEKYFETDFNRRRKYDGEITLCLPHFMNSKIVNFLMNREGILWERYDGDDEY